MSVDWKTEMANSKIVLLILAEDFYHSDGVDTLDYAIQLEKPILLVTVEGRQTPVPTAYLDYHGPKRLVQVKEDGLNLATKGRIVRAMLELGVPLDQPLESFDYQWEEKHD